MQNNRLYVVIRKQRKKINQARQRARGEARGTLLTKKSLVPRGNSREQSPSPGRRTLPGSVRWSWGTFTPAGHRPPAGEFDPLPGLGQILDTILDRRRQQGVEC
jgi:hypothetical protein